MPIFNNNITRREFLRNSASLLVASRLIYSCKDTKKYTGSIVQDNSAIGHILRDGFHMKPTTTIEIPVLIVGGGISGLSTAYHLQKNNSPEYLLLEMADKHGGNSIAGKNNLSD